MYFSISIASKLFRNYVLSRKFLEPFKSQHAIKDGINTEEVFKQNAQDTPSKCNTNDILDLDTCTGSMNLSAEENKGALCSNRSSKSSHKHEEVQSSLQHSTSSMYNPTSVFPIYFDIQNRKHIPNKINAEIEARKSTIYSHATDMNSHGLSDKGYNADVFVNSNRQFQNFECDQFSPEINNDNYVDKKMYYIEQ